MGPARLATGGQPPGGGLALRDRLSRPLAPPLDCCGHRIGPVVPGYAQSMNFESFKRGGGFSRDEHAVAMLIAFALLALGVVFFLRGFSPGVVMLSYALAGVARLGRGGLGRMIEPLGMQLPLAPALILAWPYVLWAQRQARW
jgi:hypothetical protein